MAHAGTVRKKKTNKQLQIGIHWRQPPSRFCAMSLPSGLSGRCMGSHRLALINVDQHQDGIVEEMIQRKLVQQASLARMQRAYEIMMCFCRLSGYSQENA